MQRLDSVAYEPLGFWCQSMGNRHVVVDFVHECDIVVVGEVVWWERSATTKINMTMIHTKTGKSQGNK